MSDADELREWAEFVRKNGVPTEADRYGVYAALDKAASAAESSEMALRFGGYHPPEIIRRERPDRKYGYVKRVILAFCALLGLSPP